MTTTGDRGPKVAGDRRAFLPGDKWVMDNGCRVWVLDAASDGENATALHVGCSGGLSMLLLTRRFAREYVGNITELAGGLHFIREG